MTEEPPAAGVRTASAPTGARSPVTLPDPQRSWWLHVLVLTSFAVLGALAGAVFRSSTQDTDLLVQVMSCVADATDRHRADPHSDAALAEDLVCAAVYNEQVAGYAVAGAVALPAAAWLLVLLGTGVNARRYRLTLQSPESEAARYARARFDSWCDLVGLHGRRRPRLALGPVGSSAHTAALPWGRLVVTIPHDHLYAPPGWLDLVLLHELAHVRSRDVAWASAAWWAGHLTVPVLLFAFSPQLLRLQLPDDEQGWSGQALATALALAVAVLLFRATLLRARERYADQFAVAFLTSPAVPESTRSPVEDLLARLRRGAGLRSATGGSGFLGCLRWRPRRPLALHPTVSSRFTNPTAQEPDPTAPEQGLGTEVVAVAAGTGVLAMLGAQSSLLIGVGFGSRAVAAHTPENLQVFRDLRDAVSSASGQYWGRSFSPPHALPWLSAAVMAQLLPLMLGLFVWALVLGARWSAASTVWSAVTSRHRWMPILASTTGISLGWLMHPPGALVPGLEGWVSDIPGVSVTVLVLFGLSTLLAVLADACPSTSGPRRVLALLVLVATMTVVGGAVLLITLLVVSSSTGPVPGAVPRSLLILLGSSEFAMAAVVVLLIGLLLILTLSAARRRQAAVFKRRWVPLTRQQTWTALVAVAAGTMCATATVLSHHPPDADDAVLFLGFRRWWVCALTGGITLTVLLAGSGPPTRRRSGAAFVVAAFATAVTGVGQFAVDSTRIHKVAIHMSAAL